MSQERRKSGEERRECLQRESFPTFRGPSAKNNSETTDESRLSEYTAPGSGHVQTPEISDGEQLPQEWELEEPADTNAPSEEDILQRLDRIEKRLDAFENTSYTFLLYAKQLTDRTVSFFEDIFGLSSNDLTQIHDRLGINYNNKGDYPKAIRSKSWLN